MKKIILTEGQVKKLLDKQISVISKDKKKEIFNYNSIIGVAWHDLIYDAQKLQRINFDLENNDSMGEKKTIYVKKNLRKDQPVKYEFNVELMDAGGDWEMPVMYFRVEFTHDYFYGNLKDTADPKYTFEVDRGFGQKLSNCYVVIPPVEAGNKITKTHEDSSSGSPSKYDWFAYQNNELSTEDEKNIRITNADKKNVWAWLKDLLHQLVETHHEMLD